MSKLPIDFTLSVTTARGKNSNELRLPCELDETFLIYEIIQNGKSLFQNEFISINVLNFNKPVKTRAIYLCK